MQTIVHVHNNEVKSVQAVKTDVGAVNQAKDLAEAEIGRPLTDEEIRSLETENSVHFYRGCPICDLETCSFTIADVTV